MNPPPSPLNSSVHNSKESLKNKAKYFSRLSSLLRTQSSRSAFCQFSPRLANFRGKMLQRIYCGQLANSLTVCCTWVDACLYTGKTGCISKLTVIYCIAMDEPYRYPNVLVPYSCKNFLLNISNHQIKKSHDKDIERKLTY